MPTRKTISRLSEYGFHGLLLVALLVPVFPGVFLRGEVAVSANTLFARDPWRTNAPADLAPQNVNLETPRQVLAWYYLTTKAIRDGEWPLWNPYQFTGVPLVGAYQTAVFYPPRLVFLIAENLYIAITIFILFKLWLAGFIAYVCARGLSLQTSTARFFSIAYMLGGYMMMFCSYTTVDSMGWAPLLFLGIEYLLDSRWLRGYATCLVSSSMMVLAAGAQHTLTFSLLIGAYFLARLAGRRSAPLALRACTIAGAAGLSTLLVTAIQVLPFLETVSESYTVRESLLQWDTTDYNFTSSDAPVLWAPWYFGTYLHGNFWGRLNPIYLMMAYFGVPCWIGAALFLCTKGTARARVFCLLITVGVSLWMAFGGVGTGLIALLPGFSGVRLIYFLSFAAFALPLAAAISLQQWQDTPRSRTVRAPATVAGFILVVLCLHVVFNQPNLVSLNSTFNQQGSLVESMTLNGKSTVPLIPMENGLDAFVYWQIVWSVGLLAASLVCVIAVAKRKMSGPIGTRVLTCVLVIDLVFAWRGLQPASRIADVFPETTFFNNLQVKGHPHRINFNAIGVNGLPIPYDLEELQGYDAMVPRRFWDVYDADLTQPGHIALERIAAAPAQCFPAPEHGEAKVPDGFVIDEVRDGVIVATNTKALPRARLVAATEKCDSLEHVLQRIDTPGFDPANLALVEGDRAPSLTETSQDMRGSARILDWSWNRVVVETDAARPSALVLAEAYNPGWKALLDDESELDIFAVYHVFRGVAVPAGKHTIEFNYRPLSFRIGAILSVISSVGLAIAAMVLLRRYARPRLPTPAVPPSA